MRLPPEVARARFEAARVARLATADGEGRPHVVPVTFALLDGRVVVAVDHKPKSTHDLRRLRDIDANARVSVLVDHYEEDWPRLWWARADGTARIVTDAAGRRTPLAALREKYPQYAGRPPAGPVIDIAVTRWSGWAYRD